MNTYTSVKFRIEKWQFNKKAKLINTKTEANLLMHPIFNNESLDAQGVMFKWILVITANGIEVLYYSTEEMVIMDADISDAKLLEAAENSYHTSYEALIPKNLSVGFDAGFPDYKDIPVPLSSIKNVLQLKRQ